METNRLRRASWSKLLSPLTWGLVLLSTACGNSGSGAQTPGGAAGSGGAVGAGGSAGTGNGGAGSGGTAGNLDAGLDAPRVDVDSGGDAGPVGITEADCSLMKLGDPISSAQIGEPTTGAKITKVTWNAATAMATAYCRVDGAINPVDSAAKDINFAVALPASWGRRSIQQGGGGMNGSIPNLSGTSGQTSPLSNGTAMFGSDSGHSTADGDAWAVNDEASKNLSYMQMKKTYDVSMIIIERMYGTRPRFKYYVGNSQGGREGLTVGQRYPNDYDGISSSVPVVNFSTLTLSPFLNAIQQISAAKYVPPSKATAIRNEIMRQCDKLDGLVDGIIANYIACRDVFDVTRGATAREPWADKKCPNDVDPNSADTTDAACLTSGQIETLQFVLKPYKVATPLAHGVTEFGNYLPGPGVASLLSATRYAGQEGGGTSLLKSIGNSFVVGTLLRDLNANAITRYVEGGDLDARRVEISQWSDATDPDLSTFRAHGGKWVMIMGTDDTTASSGSQLAYFQSVLDKAGRNVVDAFLRMYVVPQAGHGLSGSNATVDGDGKTIPAQPFPSSVDVASLMIQWVENGIAPPKAVVASTSTSSRPVCSYPEYPKYMGGDPNAALSYACTAN